MLYCPSNWYIWHADHQYFKCMPISHLLCDFRISLIKYGHQNSMRKVLYETKGDDNSDDRSWKNYAITLPTGHYVMEFELTMGIPLVSAAALDRVGLIECSEIPDGYIMITGRNVAGNFGTWCLWTRGLGY